MARTADDPGSAEIFSFPNSQEGTTASTATGSLDRCPCLHESPQRECSVRRTAAIMLCRMPSPRISATDSAGWANLPTTPSPDAAIAPQLPSPGSTCSWSLTRAACRDRPTTHGSMDLVSSRTRHIARSAPSPVMSSKPALAWFDTPLVTDSKGMHKPAHGTSLNGRLDLIRHALGHWRRRHAQTCPRRIVRWTLSAVALGPLGCSAENNAVRREQATEGASMGDMASVATSERTSLTQRAEPAPENRRDGQDSSPATGTGP